MYYWRPYHFLLPITTKFAAQKMKWLYTLSIFGWIPVFFGRDSPPSMAYIHAVLKLLFSSSSWNAFSMQVLRNILKFTSLYYKRSLLWAQLFLFQECACEFWGPSDKTSNCLQRSLSSMTDECVFRFKEQKFKKFSHEFFTNIRAHVFSSLIHIFTF